MQQKDAVTVLLTGRGDVNFGNLIKKMVASRGLEFDIIALKPAVGPMNQPIKSTMQFKQLFLTELMETYTGAEEIRIYEDRERHVTGFKAFFTDYNKRQNGTGTGSATRTPITAEVVRVADTATTLDPVTETASVQRIINDHNAAVTNGTASYKQRLMIKKTLFYTGYLISEADTKRLLNLAKIPANMPDADLKYLANNVLITPRPCPESILEKVGGMGSKATWEVTGTAQYENKVWAASVRILPDSKKYYTENPSPFVVLAVRKGARPIDAGKIQNWQPVSAENAIIFDSVVGEKVLLRIEAEDPQEGEYESLFPNKNLKRKHGQDDETANRQASGSYGQGQSYGNRGGSGNQKENYYPGGRGGRGNNNRGNGQRGGRGGRGGGGNGGGGGRGRGRGGHGYRSLDDVGERTSYNATPPSYSNTVAYEDFPPLQKQYQTPQQLVQQQFQQFEQFQQQNQAKGRGQGAPQELQYF